MEALEIKKLKHLNLIEPKWNGPCEKEPILGICLGYQIMFNKSKKYKFSKVLVDKGEKYSLKKKIFLCHTMEWRKF